MKFWYISVLQLYTPEGKRCTKNVFGPKRCLTVGEANDLLKMIKLLIAGESAELTKLIEQLAPGKSIETLRQTYFGTDIDLTPTQFREMFSITRENY